MTLRLTSVELISLCFKYSGLHSITLESARTYGKRLADSVKHLTGDSVVVMWGYRSLSEIDSRLIYVDEDVAELRCGIDDLCVILMGVPSVIRDAAEELEWVE